MTDLPPDGQAINNAGTPPGLSTEAMKELDTQCRAHSYKAVSDYTLPATAIGAAALGTGGGLIGGPPLAVMGGIAGGWLGSEIGVAIDRSVMDKLSVQQDAAYKKCIADSIKEQPAK